MSCERVRFRLSLLQDESGPCNTPRWVWDHVTRCEACRSFQIVTLGLAEEYRIEVWGRVHALNRLEGDSPGEYPFPRRRQSGALILAAALSVLLLGIGLSQDHDASEPAPAPPLVNALSKLPSGPSAPSLSCRTLPPLPSGPTVLNAPRPLPAFLRGERNEAPQIVFPPALQNVAPDPERDLRAPWTDVLFETARDIAARASHPFEWRVDPRPLLALGIIE